MIKKRRKDQLVELSDDKIQFSNAWSKCGLAFMKHPYNSI